MTLEKIIKIQGVVKKNLYLTLPLLSLGFLSITTNSAQAGIVFTVENPGVQTTQITGTYSVENWDSAPVGNNTSYTASGIGTYTPVNVLNADIFGGVNGTGQYLAQFTEPSTLTLDNPIAYFGLWWSAGDSNDILELYSGNTLVKTFATTDLINAISNNPAYFGNPNGGGNSGEPYAFMNFFATNGTNVDKIVFINNGGGGFESDNHTFALEEQDITGNQLPEPSSIVGIAVVGAFLKFGRRQQK